MQGTRWRCRTLPGGSVARVRGRWHHACPSSSGNGRVELVELAGVLGLALALGGLHAFDADHVMAVTALASGRARPRELLAVSARWAAGHGAALMVLGSLVLLLGMTIPPSLSRVAELAVGVLLLLIGAWVLYDLHGRRVHLHVHRHDDLPPHAHWHIF